MKRTTLCMMCFCEYFAQNAPGPPFQKARPPSCLQIFDAASMTPRYDS